MPTGSRGIGRGALRDEVRDYARDFPIGFDLTSKNWSAYVHSLLRYHDKVLAGICGSGEIWILDEGGWRLGYKSPYAPPPQYNQGAFLAHCHFTAKDLAILAGQAYNSQTRNMTLRVVTYDGTAFKDIWPDLTVGGGYAQYEFFSAVEFNDKLYLSGPYGSDAHGVVFESSDGATFTKIKEFTAPDIQGRLAVFQGYLYDVLTNGNIYRFDGSTWTLVASLGVNLYSVYATLDYIFVGGWGRVYRSSDGVNYTLIARLPGENAIIQMVRTSAGFYTCGDYSRDAAGAIYHYVRDSSLLIEPVAILEAAFVDIEEYMGVLLVGLGEWVCGSYEMTGGVIPLKPGERRLSQVDVILWKGTSIAANAETDPVATLGWARKAAYFKSSVAGTLTIYVDPVGDGTWEIYDTVAIALNTFTPYTFPQETSFARLKMAFNQIAVVDAYVVVSP